MAIMYFPVQVFLTQENYYYCKMVQRSRELLNWSLCVSWFIAPADQILQWTWKKKCHGSRAPFRALRKPDPPSLQIHMVPPFVDENSPINCKNWTYLPVILVKLLLGVNIRANIFRMEKQNITISNECSGFRAQFYSPRSEFIYDINEISHALK